MASCEECPFFDIEKTIDQYRSDMRTYLKEANSLIDTWELYQEFQNKKHILNEILPKRTAVYSLNTIQLSLSSMTWLSLMKLWDEKIGGKHNVRLARIYTFIKDGRFKKFINEEYSNYPDIVVKHIEKRKKFISLYDKYTNGKSKKIYEELKKTRNEILAHAQINSVISHKHTMNDLNIFYSDTITMIENAYYLFNVGISLHDWRERVRHNANIFVNLIGDNKFLPSP